MDINHLKFGFACYLRTIKGDEEIKYDPTSDISIFQYAKEFKQYIQTKYSSDELNLSTMSIGDILDLEIVNGQLVDPEKLAEDKEENDENTSSDESNRETIDSEAQQSPTSDDEQIHSSEENKLDKSEVLNILNSLLEDDLFSGAIDQDQNGEFSNDELSNFFNAISVYDGDGSNVSLNDILSAAEDIKMNNFSFNLPETNIFDTIPNSTSPTQTTAQTSIPSSISGAYNPAGYYNAGRSTTPTGNTNPGQTVEKPKNIDNMSYQELETELTSANADLSEKESKLEAIQSGNDDVVAPLKEAMEQALSDYTEALENQDSEEAQRLSEVTKEIEEQETQQRENEEQKQNCEDQIEIADKDIAHYDTVINNCTNAITTLDHQITDLTNQLNSVQDDSEDPSTVERYKAFINQQISDATAERDKLKTERENAETAKYEAEQKRNNANLELQRLEEAITQNDEDLEALKSEQATLENAVFAENPELQQMKQTYLDAKDAYTTTRESEIAQAKEDITKAQEYVEKVTNRINEAREEEYDKKYSVVEMSDFDSFEKAIDWAKQYVGMDQNAMQEIFRQMGYPFHDRAWCGDFTRMVLLSQIGEDNLADWFKECPNLAYCPTIQISGQGHEITDWNEARPGDVVLFDWESSRDGSADHVGIVIGYDPETDTLITIEGNTTGSGGGSCVEIKQRKREDIINVYNTHKN